MSLATCSANESAVRELSDEMLKKGAPELTGSLRRNPGVDWSRRERGRARLRPMVKRISRKCRYPPDRQEAAANLVLCQMEAICGAWG